MNNFLKGWKPLRGRRDDGVVHQYQAHLLLPCCLVGVYVLPMPHAVRAQEWRANWCAEVYNSRRVQ